MNDLSAHPAPDRPRSECALATHNSIILNTLADLTNRENRLAYQRFANDFQRTWPEPALRTTWPTTSTATTCPTITRRSMRNHSQNPPTSSSSSRRTSPPRGSRLPHSHGFPLRLPGRLLLSPDPEHAATAPYGWIHSPNPQVYIASTNSNVAFDSNTRRHTWCIFNRSTTTRSTWATTCRFPGGLPRSDVLTDLVGLPDLARDALARPGPTPPCRSTCNRAQPIGLTPRSTATLPVTNDRDLLPPMRVPSPTWPISRSSAANPTSYSDGWGAASNFWAGTASPSTRSGPELGRRPDHDGRAELRHQGLRQQPGRLRRPGVGRRPAADQPCADRAYRPLRRRSSSRHRRYGLATLTGDTNRQSYDTLNQTFAHEGRMPPLVEDSGSTPSIGPDLQHLPAVKSPVPRPTTRPTSSNIGDDQLGIVRLRRVWDSWSTEYTRARAPGST